MANISAVLIIGTPLVTLIMRLLEIKPQITLAVIVRQQSIIEL